MGAVIIVTGAVGVGCGGSDGSALFTGVVPDGGEGGTGSSGGDGGRAADGAVNLPVGTIAADGGTGNNAAPGGNTGQVACGSASCLIPGETCCVFSGGGNGGGAGRSYLCVVGTSCTGVDAGRVEAVSALACTGAANCPTGTVCCATHANGTTTSACQTTCTGGDTVQLCDPKANPTGCPGDAGVCQADTLTDWGLPASFGSCRPPG